MEPGIGKRAEREIAHGRILTEGDPERAWGWATPAGKQRAARRAELVSAGARLGIDPACARRSGAARGMFTEIFARTGATIVAVDISPDLLQKARARGLLRIGYAPTSSSIFTWQLPVCKKNGVGAT